MEKSDRPKIKYGIDDMTMSLNINDRKEEDRTKFADRFGNDDFTPCDWTAKIVIDGKTYWANLYDKEKNGVTDGTWKAGRVKPQEKKLNDEIPF